MLACYLSFFTVLWATKLHAKRYYVFLRTRNLIMEVHGAQIAANAHCKQWRPLSGDDMITTMVVSNDR